jgi:hypothetical protein
MIIPDVNLLIYAYNEDAPGHAGAKRWWEASLSAARPVALPWVVLLGFVRLMSDRRVIDDPMPAAEAVQHCKAWLVRPNARIILPGPGHLDLLADLLRAASAGTDLVMDAHLAALAIEHQAELHANDSDFAPFPGLRRRNPIA